MKLRLKRKLFIALFAYVILFLGCFFLFEKIPYGIRINQTPSLPYKIFLSGPLKTLTRNSYVSFLHSTNSRLLAKQIIGIPGDSISCRDDHIFVNDYDCGHAFNTTSSGLSLTPIEAEEIPNGYVFVHATHSESFDSRYQQFGLVQISQLEEVLWPIY